MVLKNNKVADNLRIYLNIYIKKYFYNNIFECYVI